MPSRFEESSFGVKLKAKPQRGSVNLYGVGCALPVFDQVKQILPYLFRSHPVGTFAKVAGEALNGVEVAIDSIVCVVAKSKFIDHSLS
jgi:hypothetical protein